MGGGRRTRGGKGIQRIREGTVKSRCERAGLSGVKGRGRARWRERDGTRGAVSVRSTQWGQVELNWSGAGADTPRSEALLHNFRSAGPARCFRFRSTAHAPRPTPSPDRYSRLGFSQHPNTARGTTAAGGGSALSLLVSLQHLKVVHVVTWDRLASVPRKAIYINPAFH